MNSASIWTVNLLFVLGLFGGLASANFPITRHVRVTLDGFEPQNQFAWSNDVIRFYMHKTLVKGNWSIAETNITSLAAGCLPLKGNSSLYDGMVWDCYQNNCTTTKVVRSHSSIFYGIRDNSHSRCSRDKFLLQVDVHDYPENSYSNINNNHHGHDNYYSDHSVVNDNYNSHSFDSDNGDIYYDNNNHHSHHDYHHFSDADDLYKEFYDSVPPPRRHSKINDRFNNYHGHNNYYSFDSDNCYGHDFDDNNHNCHACDNNFVFTQRRFYDNRFHHCYWGFNSTRAATGYKPFEFITDMIRKDDYDGMTIGYSNLGLGIVMLFLYVLLLQKISNMQRQLNKAQEVIKQLLVMQNVVPASTNVTQQPVADTKLVILDA